MAEKEGNKALKILVSGDVEGRLENLYSKIRSIQNKAGKFDLLICVGEFFAEDPKDNVEIDKYISDPSSIPITTYVIGTKDSKRVKHFTDPAGYEICKDKIMYLGPKGLYTTQQGLSIAYLSGSESKSNAKRLKPSDKDSDDSSDESDYTDLVNFTLKDIDSIENNCQRRDFYDFVDILLTSQWPKYVEKFSNQPLDNNKSSEKFGSELISNLAVRIKPRYHFSASENIFYERIPYRNHQVLAEKDKHVSKFLALAKVNKSNKPKFLYAFNIIPGKSMDYRDLVKQSGSQVTDSPYNSYINIIKSQSKRQNEDSESSLQYFYDADHIKKMSEINERAMNDKKRKQEESKARAAEPCWFCLGGSKIERHYIVSVGDKCYLAYAKGAINKDHLLIIPIDHIQSSTNADDALLKDIEKYKLALKKYFRSRNKCVLFYERNFHSKHMQIQAYAIKMDKIYLLKDAFMSIAKDQNVYLNEIPEFTNLKQVMGRDHSFYYLELPDEDEDQNVSKDEVKLSLKRYLAEIRGQGFPINFGRDVIASELLLNVPERVDWKECVKSQEEEKQMSVDFRNSFKSYDPFL